MKVEMTEDLRLIVTPENSVEAVALRYWGNNFEITRTCGEASLVLELQVPTRGTP